MCVFVCVCVCVCACVRVCVCPHHKRLGLRCAPPWSSQNPTGWWSHWECPLQYIHLGKYNTAQKCNSMCVLFCIVNRWQNISSSKALSSLGRYWSVRADCICTCDVTLWLHQIVLYIKNNEVLVNLYRQPYCRGCIGYTKWCSLFWLTVCKGCTEYIDCCRKYVYCIGNAAHLAL